MTNDIMTDSNDNFDNDGSLDAAADAFLKKWETEDAETPSDLSEEETDEHFADEADESDGNETEAHDDEHVDEDGESEADDEDERVIKHKVNGKEVSYKIKDIKRHMGRFEALGAKEAELAELRKANEAHREKNAFTTEQLAKRAAERYAPFEAIDWVVAGKQWDAETLSAVRKEAFAAFEDVKFFEGELQKLYDEAKVEQARTHEEQSKAYRAVTEQTISTLRQEFPKQDLNKLHQNWRAYAVKNGIPEAEFNQVNRADYLRIIHKAMLFDRGQNAQTKKVGKPVTKTIKTSKNVETVRNATKPNDRSAMTKLRQTGSLDDAANAFLSRWNKK